MATNNQRGKGRRNSSMQDYAGQSLVSNQVAFIPPLNSLAPNGSARQTTASIPFNVDTSHMVQQQYAQARPSNPVIRYAAGEAQIDSAAPSSVTIRTRMAPPNFASTAQVSFSAQPQMAYHQSLRFYNSRAACNSYGFTPQPGYYFSTSMFAPTVDHNFLACQTSDYVSQRYQQQVPVSVTMPVQKGKRILRIVDPNTHEVTNEKEITASLGSCEDQYMKLEPVVQEKKCVSAPMSLVDMPSSPSSNVSHQLVLQVAKSIVENSPTISESSTPALSQSAVNADLVQPTSLSSSPLEMASVDIEVELDQSSSVSSSTGQLLDENSISVAEQFTISVDEAAESKVDSGHEANAIEAETSIASDIVVEDMIEEVANDETSENGEDARVMNELLGKFNDLRIEEESSIDNGVYSRAFLLLRREILKTAKVDCCPLSKADLESLGIDIASAPPVAERQRRYDGSSSFAPAWVVPGTDKNVSKSKAYHGRSSDRGHTNQRKRPTTTSRPSYDLRTSEPVELHKAESAWKRAANIEDPVEGKLKVIRELLNKITPSTFDVLSQKFLSYKVTGNENLMKDVIAVIFEKAVEEPKFCPLYSDLCKVQVVEEAKEVIVNNKTRHGTTEFRSGILNRCQNTFTSKGIAAECSARKMAIDVEKDENRKKELTIDLMELEAKERRRMFGNINFMGQLFRHGLIVPKILNWCMIHLLRSIDQAEDEESLECAIKMLETVGPRAQHLRVDKAKSNPEFAKSLGKPDSDRSQQSGESNVFNTDMYMEFLAKRQSTFSHRLRCLTMNLFELRDRGWLTKAEAEGPKKIEEVHDDARKEELQNKVQREMYERRRYDGRTSSDRRNPRPTIVARHSQDGRFSNRVLESNRDPKARAAVASTLITGTTGRKNQSLNSVDQPSSLGARRPLFSSGSGGGGMSEDQTDRSNSLYKNVSSSLRGSGRGPVSKRENSRSINRESSECRSDLQRDVNSPTVSSMEGTSDAGRPNASRDPSITRQKYNSREGMEIVNRTVICDLQDYSRNPGSIDEFFGTVTETCDKYGTQCTFHSLLKVGVEVISAILMKNVWKSCGLVLCKVMQDGSKRNETLLAIVDFCAYVIEMELWVDHVRVWENVAEFICWSLIGDNSISGIRPSLKDFECVFKGSILSDLEYSPLLVEVLKGLAVIEYENDKQVLSLQMAFEEINDLHTEPLLKALKLCQSPIEDTFLFELLN